MPRGMNLLLSLSSILVTKEHLRVRLLLFYNPPLRAHVKRISVITTAVAIVMTVHRWIIYRSLNKITKLLFIACNENGLSGWVVTPIVVYNFETMLRRHTRCLRKLISSSEVNPNNRAIGG